MSRPTLALCIPAFNAASFLPRLLIAATRQEIAFDEVLVYDDFSADNTSDVARRFGARVIRGAINMGCSAAKNRLLEATTCDWIHFHDADDLITPHFTVLAHKWIERTSVPDVVLFDYEIRTFEDERLLAIRRFNGSAVREDPARYCIRHQINPYCGLYRAASLRRVGGYDEDPAVLYNEDCRFHMKLAFSGLTFDVETTLAVVNLERPSSMSHGSRDRCAVARLAVLEKASEEAAPRLFTEIGLEAWLNARHLGYYGRFREMARAIRLARTLRVCVPVEERNIVVRWLSILAPVFAFTARARFVRWRDCRAP